jgi:hypothetical protein
MNEINWNEMIGFLNDVDDMVEEFTKLFLDIARQSIPTKTITVRDYDKPWFNNEIRKEIRLRDRLRKNVMKSTISLAVTKMSVIEALVLLSKGGTGIFSSSNLDTKLKYLFNSSHFLSSSYTISSINAQNSPRKNCRTTSNYL